MCCMVGGCPKKMKFTEEDDGRGVNGEREMGRRRDAEREE